MAVFQMETRSIARRPAKTIVDLGIGRHNLGLDGEAAWGDPILFENSGGVLGADVLPPRVF
jgi:hypothetical protein